MVELSLPKLDDAKVAQIAQSDRWTVLARLSSIFAAAVTTLLLAPLVIWGFTTLQSASITLTKHSGDIANVQATVDQIQKQAGSDHDNLIILGTRFDTFVASIPAQKTARDLQVQEIKDAIKQLWQRREFAPKDPTP